MGPNIRTTAKAVVVASVACCALLSACSSRPGEIAGGANEESLSSCSFSVTKNTYDGSSYWGTVTVKNDSSSSLTGFSVTFSVPSGDHCTNDTVPSGATLGPLSGSGTSAVTQSNVCTFTWANTKIGAGASLTFHYSTDNTNFSAATGVTVSSSACTAGAGSPPPANSSSGSTSGSCSFGVTTNSYDGSNYWGTLAFANDGPSAATGYSVQFSVPSGDHCTNDTVPSGATLSPLTGSGTSATTTSNVCTFTWPSATLPAGASVTFNYSTDNTDFSSASNVKVSAASCGSGSTGGGGGGPVATNTGRQLLMWLPTWVDWPDSLSTVTNSNPKIASIVSPDFYDFNANGNYTSGPPSLAYWGSPTIAQVAQQVHAAGMLLVPLVYGGASNLSHGTDQGIQNVLSNSTIQKNFIAAMVSEAQSQHYDGWNLDWEVDPSMTYAQFGAQYISFLSAFKKALNAQHMILTVDVAQWYIRQCGGDALVDLGQIGSAVDYAIIEDYVTAFGSPVTSCSTRAWQNDNCSTFGDLMNLMCAVTPSSAVSIGLMAEPGGTTSQGGTTEGTGPILRQALSAVSAAGFTAIAVWPDGSPFLDSTGVPNGQTFASSLGQWLNTK
jgi:hypothetical protein